MGRLNFLYNAIKESLYARSEWHEPKYITLLVSLVGLFLHVCFLVVFYFLNIIELVYFNILSILMWTIALILAAKHDYVKATAISALEIVLHAYYATYLLGINLGFHLYIWALLVWVTYIYIKARKHGFVSGVVCLFTFLLLAVVEQSEWHEPKYTFSHDLEVLFHISNLFISGFILVFMTYFVAKSIQNKQDELSALAIQDALTGLYNRHYMIDFVEKYQQKAKRQQEPYCFVMADIDYFKKINDQYGHNGGDKVMEFLGEFLKTELRAADVISRWGGEEFLILLINCKLDEAVMRVEMLRQKINSNTYVRTEKGEIDFTVSFGVAEAQHNESMDQLIIRTDELLYKAKEAGRDQVVIQ